MLLPSLIFLIGVVIFLYIWYRESRATILFTPFFVFSVNDITRNWIAGFAAPIAHTTPDFYSFYVFVGAYVVFALAFVVTSSATKYSASLPLIYRSRPIHAGNDRVHLLTVLLALAAVGALSLYFFGGIPIAAVATFDFLKGTGDDQTAALLGAAREVLSKGHIFGGDYAGQGILTSIIRAGWALLVAITYLRWRALRNGTWAILAAATLVLAIIFVGGDGTRGYVLWTLIYLLVVVSLVRSIPWSYAFAAIAALVLLAIGLSVISPKLHWALGRSDFWLLAVKAIAERAFLSNGYNTVDVMDLVREGAWHLRFGGAFLQKITAALPGTPSGPPIAYELFRAMNPHASHATTFSSATYVAEAYLDFGIIGALTGYAFAGIVIAVLQQMLFATKKGTFALPMVAFVILTLGRFPLVGPVAIMSTLAVAAILCFFLWFFYSIVLMLGQPAPRSAEIKAVPAS